MAQIGDTKSGRVLVRRGPKAARVTQLTAVRDSVAVAVLIAELLCPLEACSLEVLAELVSLSAIDAATVAERLAGDTARRTIGSLSIRNAVLQMGPSCSKREQGEGPTVQYNSSHDATKFRPQPTEYARFADPI